MRVAFRTDASLTIGTGHIMRCLTLADALSSLGAECVFLCRDHVGSLHQDVQNHGHKLISLGNVSDEPLKSATSPYLDSLGVDLQTDIDDTIFWLSNLSVDWLVVDHYALSEPWEQAMRSVCNRIMAIDDLANRKHDVDVLLDQNLGRSSSHYEDLVLPNSKLMLGADYTLLRPEFLALREGSLSRRCRGKLQKILITMGGVDLENVTGAVLDALNMWGPPEDFEVTVVLGKNSPWYHAVVMQLKSLSFPVKVLLNIQDIEHLMFDADIAIGAAGTTSWERCCMGLPTLLLVLAENQRYIANALSFSGAADLLDRTDLQANLGAAMDRLSRDPVLLLSMSNAASKLVDGLGAMRVASFLNEWV